MAGNSLALVWDLIARDGASPVFARVSAAADKTAASTEAAAVKTGASLSAMTKVAAVAGLAFAAVAVKMASDFNAKMLLVQTQAGASAAEVRKMTPAILSLAGKVAQAPEALATSLYHVESTGLRGAAALEAVKVAAEGARVGHADLEETTNALTATIASGMVPATESFSAAMGQLNTIVGSGDMKLSDLNDALGTGFMVQVKQYGATLNDVGAALADFGDNNIRGADAATMLRMAVQAIAKPGVGAAAALGKIGLTTQQLQSDEQTGGLNKALTDLHTHLVSSGIDATQWGALMTDAFTKKAGGGIITLIGTYDRFEQKYKEVQKGAASFGAAWAATTKTAAFQAAALKDNIDAMTISVGTHLLPVVTATMSWINQTGIPALQHLGGAALDVAHWFGQLPAPIKDTALALAGLGLANAIGLTGALGSGLSRVVSVVPATKTALAGLSDEMRIQASLGAMQSAALSDVDRALGANAVAADTAAASWTRVQIAQAGYDEALLATNAQLAGLAFTEGEATVTTVTLGDALATMAGRAEAAAAGGVTRFISMLGGPWVLALAAAGAAVYGLVKYMTDEHDIIPKVTVDTQGLTSALEASNSAMDDAVVKAAALALQQAGLFKAGQQWGISTSLLTEAALGNKTAMEQVSAAAAKYKDAQDKAAGSANNGSYQAGLAGDAYKRAGMQSDEWLAAIKRLAGGTDSQLQKQKDLATAVDGVSKATTDAGNAAQNAGPKLEFAGSAAGMSAAQVKSANKEWEAWIKNLSGIDQAFTDPLTTYEGLLSDKQAAEQKSAQATADATKSGKDSWQDYVKNVGVSLSEYASKLEDELKNEQDWQNNLVKIAQRGGIQVAQQFADMGQKGADITAAMANATNADFTRMATDMINQANAGGQGAAAALDTKMRVMAEIGAEGGAATAKAVSDALGVGINDVAAIAQQYGVTLATGLEPILQGLGKPPIVVPGFVTRPGLIGRNADGGFISGPGTGRSDSILSFLSNGEFVVNADATASNRPLLEALNSAPRFAGGGFASANDVPRPSSTAPYGALIASPSDGTMSLEYGDVTDYLRSMAFAPGAPANVNANAALARQMAAQFYGWTGAEWNALFALGMRESGWNNNAQNPTSTAYGIAQFLDSTWATVGLSKTSNPAVQIAGMDKYIANRYVDPLGAWAHETRFGWYKDGTNYVPSDQLAMLHRGEAVVPASQNQGAPYKSGPAVFNLYDADGVLMGTMRGEAVGAVTEYADAHFNRGQYN